MKDDLYRILLASLWVPPLKGCQTPCVLLHNCFLFLSLDSKQERKESVAHVY